MSDADRAHFALFFDVADRWDSDRRGAKRARRSTGRTSIAVSKETAIQLRRLAANLRLVGGWGVGFLSLDELLAVLAAGNFVKLSEKGSVAAQAVLATESAPKPKKVARARAKDMENGEDDA